jgi:hypothetical protein
MMSSETIAMIATTVLAVLGFVGVVAIAMKYVNVVKEFGDVLVAVTGSLKDLKVLPEEVEAIKKELEEFKEAVRQAKN